MKQVYESAEVQISDEAGGFEACTFKVYRDYKVGRGKPVAGFTVVQSGPEMGEVPMITYPSPATGQHSATVFADTIAGRYTSKPTVRRRVHR